MTSIALAFIAATTSFNLPAGLLSAVCYVESNHNVKAINLYDGGSPSHGLCQVKLATARQMGYRGTAEALRRPEANIRWAAHYLSDRISHYDGDTLRGIAAYNSGTFRLDKTGRPRNLRYVQKVLKAWEERR